MSRGEINLFFHFFRGWRSDLLALLGGGWVATLLLQPARDGRASAAAAS